MLVHTKYLSWQSDDSEEEKINKDKEKQIDYPDKVFNYCHLASDPRHDSFYDLGTTQSRRVC